MRTISRLIGVGVAYGLAGVGYAVMLRVSA
jgi:hypothetical protein